MENNIVLFDEALKAKKLEDEKLLEEGLEEAPITEEDEAEIAAMKKEAEDTAYIVRDGDKEVPLDEFLKPVDEAIPTLKDGTKLVSMTQPERSEFVSSIRTRSAEQLRNAAPVDISEDDFRDLMQKTLAAVKQGLKVTELHRDSVADKLAVLPLEEILEMVPRQLIDVYVPAAVMKDSKRKAKEILISTIEYMVAIGPDSDDFAEYLENQNKLYMVLQAVANKSLEMKDVLSSKETIAEIAKKVVQNADPRTISYMKYVKSPDAINTFFGNKAEISRKFEEAYKELIPNYSDPVEIEALQHEIDEAAETTKMYESILELETFKSSFNSFVQEFNTDKRSSATSLEKMARKYVERMKRANFSAPFPGFTGGERNVGELYVKCLKHFDEQIDLYNKYVAKSNETENPKLQLIGDKKVFCNTLLIVMGRIQKKLLKNSASYRDKNELVAYFELFCRLCTDIFTTAKVVELLNPVTHSKAVGYEAD